MSREILSVTLSLIDEEGTQVKFNESICLIFIRTRSTFLIGTLCLTKLYFISAVHEFKLKLQSVLVIMHNWTLCARCLKYHLLVFSPTHSLHKVKIGLKHRTQHHAHHLLHYGHILATTMASELRLYSPGLLAPVISFSCFSAQRHNNLRNLSDSM